jgi:hypothetical protein
MANCPTVRYGEKVSWNVRAGAGCMGCVMPNFWDAMGPVYTRLPSPVPFLPNVTVDMVGAAMVGGIAVVAGAHAVGMSGRYKRRGRIERQEAAAAAASTIDPTPASTIDATPAEPVAPADLAAPTEPIAPVEPVADGPTDPGPDPEPGAGER